MSDDAHGLGVVGDGRGSSFAWGDDAIAVPLQMGTLSKAVGGYGGYLCASHSVAELIRNRARSFVYSTGLPPGAVAAASGALDIIARTRRSCADRSRARASSRPRSGCRRASSAIVSIGLGAAERALAASDGTARRGLSRRGDPSADRAARHFAPAIRVLGRAYRRSKLRPSRRPCARCLTA